ncbi:MAG: endonuclease domain-containing protein [Oscillospiraceae bacterium]|nr:endonuclease domain-containing protein [Oscillospiraceae bacterium]
MNKTSNNKLTGNAKNLRKNMTKQEKRLWYDFLKNLPITVNRQKVIGNYIVDFYIAISKLVIEIDGSQHYEDKGIENDEKRDEYLSNLGIKVLRYSNVDINQRFESVCADILREIDTSSTASGPPSPQGEG